MSSSAASSAEAEARPWSVVSGRRASDPEADEDEAVCAWRSAQAEDAHRVGLIALRRGNATEARRLFSKV